MSQVTYAAEAGQTVFTIPFDYLTPAHLTLGIDGVEETDWSLSSPNTLVLGGSVAPLLEGQRVTIIRSTPSDELVSVFSGSSQIRASEITRVARQLLFIAQEANFESAQALRRNVLGTVWDGEATRLTNLAPAVDPEDAATLATVTNLLATGGVLPQPTLDDLFKNVRVINSGSGPVYSLQPSYGARVHLRIPPASPPGLLGFNLGHLIDPSGAITSNWNAAPNSPVPLSVRFAVGTPVGGAVAIDPNGVDILLPPGTWEYQVIGSVRSRTNTGSVNFNTVSAALTNSTGTTVYDQHQGVALGASGGATNPFPASASINMMGFIGVGVTTRINLRLSAASSADNVFADVPFTIRLEEIIR